MGAVSIICGTTGLWAILAYAVVSSPAIYGEEQSFNMQTAEVKEFQCSHCLYFSYSFLHTSPIPGELHYHALLRSGSLVNQLTFDRHPRRAMCSWGFGRLHENSV